MARGAKVRERVIGKQSKENHITAGGIETASQGFWGNITTQAPFLPVNGVSKKPATGTMPTTAAGRGGAKAYPIEKRFQSSAKSTKGGPK